jgi:hypothetical protein
MKLKLTILAKKGEGKEKGEREGGRHTFSRSSFMGSYNTSLEII